LYRTSQSIYVHAQQHLSPHITVQFTVLQSHLLQTTHCFVNSHFISVWGILLWKCCSVSCQSLYSTVTTMVVWCL